jgi:Zn finger protein HypA/HybF involved in hydrogenase expression
MLTEMEKQEFFCPECREKTTYHYSSEVENYTIHDKEYSFKVIKAFCDNCGSEVEVKGLMDSNIQSIVAQYRKEENLVTSNDKKIMI